MSEHRKDEPTMLTIPDRLPGEAELSELYQKNADEQPSLLIDQLILNEADKAVQPPSHLRLIFRRWTVPLTLAAGLLVSIGVMTMLQDNMISPVVMQSERVQPMSSGQIEQEHQALTGREAPAFVAKPQRRESAADTLSPDAFSRTAEENRPSGYVGFGAALERQATKDRRKREAALIPQASSSRGVGPTSLSAARMKRVPEERMVPLRQESKANDPSGAVESPSLDPLRGKIVVKDMSSGRQRTDKTPLKSLRDMPGVLGLENLPLPESPNRWLKEVTDLFQAGHHREAEESLRAFHRKYPRFDDFPEDFPQELLDKVSAEASSDEH